MARTMLTIILFGAVLGVIQLIIVLVVWFVCMVQFRGGRHCDPERTRERRRMDGGRSEEMVEREGRGEKVRGSALMNKSLPNIEEFEK